MKAARGRFAVLAAFSLAGVVALVPAVPAAPDAADGDERPAPPSIYAGTGIGIALEANGNEVPRTGEQMMKALEKIGEFAQLPITYSAVDLRSGLQNPRVVITQRPSMVVSGLPPINPPINPPVNPPANPAIPGAKGDPDDPVPALTAAFGVPVQTPVSTGKLTRPNLEGRLFIAANFEKRDGELKVKTFEFISWNGRKQRFDFGFIECDEVEPRIRLVDGIKCFSCHKNKGPILGQGPWSNTPHNDMIRAALNTRAAPKGPALPALPVRATFLDSDLGQPRRLDTGFVSARVVKGAEPLPMADGIPVALPQGPAVDAAVRMGADLIRDRDVYRAMARSPDGRKGLQILFGAIVAPGALEQTDRHVKVALDQTFSLSYNTFAEKWVALHKNSLDTLADFNPSGSMGTVKPVKTGSAGGWGGGSTLKSELRVVWSGDAKMITDYDAKRADGEHALPSTRQPSNPKAFIKPEVKLPGKPSAAVSATGLARLIGLTEGDRSFFADQLAVAARLLDKPKVTAATLAKDVFGGPQFANLLLAAEIPDREDFKDRFVKGLNEALKAQGADELRFARSDYASGPNVAPIPGKEENEIPFVATTACVRCHDVQKPGKAAFNPIPVLAFDPFDKTSRETWVKANPDVRKRAPVLVRMMKRLQDDKDMPPEDSAEYEAFRVKEPTALDPVRDWLDAELKKAKGD